jgi:endonuclease G, mitochondrial
MLKRLTVVVGLSIAATGCTHATQGVRVATHTTLTVSNAAPDPALIDKHCPFGAPQKLPALEHGPTVVIARQAYALEHDAAAKIALWVCGSLDVALVFGTAERRDRWGPEPELQGNSRAVDADYKNSGFQRGHMVASEDRVASQALNDATFVLSNAVPQNGPLNGGQWAQLEAAIRKWVEDGVVKNARMITGGFFYDPAEDTPSTADGIVTFQQIGAGNVAVPTHIFKIVVGERSDGKPRAIAFVAANRKPKTGWKFADAIVSIQFVEQRAGLNFMPDLGPAEAAALESTPSPLWHR